MSEAECPWCGKSNGDLWELWPHDSSTVDGFEDDSQECGWCEKPVTVKCVVDVTYSMVKRDAAQPSGGEG